MVEDIFNSYEKSILWTIFFYGHCTSEFLISTTPKNDREDYKKYLARLIREGYIQIGFKDWLRIDPSRVNEIKEKALMDFIDPILEL